MPVVATCDVQSYFGALIEDHFQTLDIEEQMTWIVEVLFHKGTLRAWVEEYVDDCMSLDPTLATAIMNSVDWNDLYIWAEENLKDSIQDECDYCNKSYYTHLMIFRDCCKHFCVGCINKHDDQCIEYTDPENNKNKTLCLVCD